MASRNIAFSSPAATVLALLMLECGAAAQTSTLAIPVPASVLVGERPLDEGSRAPSQARQWGRLRHRQAPVWPSAPSPTREFGLHRAVWSSHQESTQLSYARYFDDEIAIEGAIDVVRAAHRSFAVTTLQARVTPPTETGPATSIVCGLAYSFAGSDHPARLKGLGAVLGGGLQPRFTRHFALRTEFQIFRFPRSDGTAIRLSLGVLVGRD
jgi:hypothetical protein